MKKNKTAPQIKHTKKSVPFDQVSIEIGPELGVNFDEDGFPSGSHNKKELFERRQSNREK